jgi:hypothetical protein
LEEQTILTEKEAVMVTQVQLMEELAAYEKELKQKLVNLEIDVEEALEMYLARRDETEGLIEHGRRLDGRYRRRLFDEALEGYREIQSGVLQKVRLDLPKLTSEQLLTECSKDLHTVDKEVGDILGELTRRLSKWKGSPELKLQARYFQAMTKLLTVLAKQNQVLINLHQEQGNKAERKH